MLLTRKNAYHYLIVLSLFVFCGCVTTNQISPSSSIDNGFDIGSSVETITLLPVDDNRKGKTNSENYNKLTKDLETELFFKGYEVKVASEFWKNAGINAAEMIDIKACSFAEQGPSDSEFLFLFSLNDNQYANAGIVSEASVEATGHLIDKQKKCFVWKGECSASETAFGLVGTLLTPVKGLSMRKCFLNMFSEFPHKSE